MLDVVLIYTIILFLVETALAIVRLGKGVSRALYFKHTDSKMSLPGSWPLEEPSLEEPLQTAVPMSLPSDASVNVLPAGEGLGMGSVVTVATRSERSLAKPEERAIFLPVCAKRSPRAPVVFLKNPNDKPEFESWATEGEEGGSDSSSDSFGVGVDLGRSRAKNRGSSAVADAIRRGLQNALNKRAARGSGQPAAADSRAKPEFKLRTADLRSLPRHLDPRFRGKKIYAPGWQPAGRPPSDMSPTEFYERREGPVESWVGDQDQQMELYVDPDCRDRTPATFAEGLTESNGTIIAPSLGPGQTQDERQPLGDLPPPVTPVGASQAVHTDEAVQADESVPPGIVDQHHEAAQSPAGAEINIPTSENQEDPVQPTLAEPSATEKSLTMVPVPLEEYVRLKEIAVNAEKAAATFETRLEQEFKRLRDEMSQMANLSGQLSDPESENRRPCVQKRVLPIALSPSLGSQIPSSLLGRAILRRDDDTAKLRAPQPDMTLSELDKKIRTLQRLLDKEPAAADALKGVDLAQLAIGTDTGEWDGLNKDQQALLFSTMLQVAAKDSLEAIELAEKVGRTTVKVVTKTKKPDQALEAERDWFKKLLGDKFDEFWNEIRPNLSFDKDPLAFWNRRIYPPFYPATGQMPPKPSKKHIKMEFPQIRDELEMILREIRRFSKQFFSSPGNEDLSPEMHEFLLGMCGGSRELLRALLKNEDMKYLLISGFIKRVLFNICLGTGWIWQGYDDNLSGLFSLERNLYHDPGYNYQRTVALTWRAHRFTQLTNQPWWEHMLELRIKLVADELYKLLRPLQGENRSKNEFRQVEVFIDLLEIVEYFSKLSAKMYEHEALWQYRFPERGEEFDRANMVWDDPSQNKTVAIRGSE
ncbi:hypothetical protein TWF281_011642 [Arthrobotrys megalospora]